MHKKIGILGNTGRMGKVLAQVIEGQKNYQLGTGFSRSQKLSVTMDQVFADNDYIVDFSNASLTETVLNCALKHHKPLIICTTGWGENDNFLPLIAAVTKVTPLVIAPNTSIGACLQRYLSNILAKILDQSYDIDIFDVHHRNKIDSPSGTSLALAQDIAKAKKKAFDLEYRVNCQPWYGVRPENQINIAAQRKGNVFGEHQVSFTSENEMLAIQHLAFDRKIFANGVITILNWLVLNSPPPKRYDMFDVLNLH